jgi:hypothetical protein
MMLLALASQPQALPVNSLNVLASTGQELDIRMCTESAGLWAEVRICLVCL